MGIPEVLRSDYGPQIHHQVLRSPEYPWSNGLAEKTVQTVESLLEKAKDDDKDPHLRILDAWNTLFENYRSLAETRIGFWTWIWSKRHCGLV